jgi:hypothetical protein
MKTLTLAALVLAASRPSAAGGFIVEAPGEAYAIPAGPSFAFQSPTQLAPTLLAPGIASLAAPLSAPGFAAAPAASSLYAAAAPITESDVKSRFTQITGVMGVEVVPEQQMVRVRFSSRVPLEWAQKSGGLPKSIRLYGSDYAIVPSLASEAGQDQRQDEEKAVAARFTASKGIAQAKAWIEPADDGSLDELDARTAAQAQWRQETAAQFAQIPGAAKAEALFEGRSATVTVEFSTREALEAAKKSGLLPGSVKSPAGLDYTVVPTLSHADSD